MQDTRQQEPMGYDEALARTNQIRVMQGKRPHPYGWKAGMPEGEPAGAPILMWFDGQIERFVP